MATREIRSVLVSIRDDGYQCWESEQEDAPMAARVLTLHPHGGGASAASEHIGDTAILRYMTGSSFGLWMFTEWEAPDAD